MSELNLLQLTRQKAFSDRRIWLVLLAGLVYAVAAPVYPGWAVLIAAFVFVIFIASHLDWGLSLMALFAFFHGLEIDFSRYPWAKDVPYLPTLNAPVVDFIAVAVFASVVIAWLFRLSIFAEKFSWRWPAGARWYGLFIVASVIAAATSPEHVFVSSLKYVERPVVFVYVAFVLLPIIIIRTKEQLIKILRLWWWIGVGVAVFGLVSLVAVPQSGWIRVVPFGWWGYAPLGYNHNLLAEVLVAIVPIGLYMIDQARDAVERKWYIAFTIGMVLVTLLTLSRAAWLVLGLEYVVYRYFRRGSWRDLFNRGPRTSLLIVGLLALMSTYLFIFLGSATVTSSNAARWDTTRVVALYVTRAPWFGYGPGMYVPLLSTTALYLLNYGEALDAHGLAQKVVLEEGVIGLLLFIGWLGAVIRALWQAVRHEPGDALPQTLFLMAVGAIVFQLFNTSYFNSVMWFPIGVALAGLACRRSEQSV